MSSGFFFSHLFYGHDRCLFFSYCFPSLFARSRADPPFLIFPQPNIPRDATISFMFPPGGGLFFFFFFFCDREVPSLFRSVACRTSLPPIARSSLSPRDSTLTTTVFFLFSLGCGFPSVNGLCILSLPHLFFEEFFLEVLYLILREFLFLSLQMRFLILNTPPPSLFVASLSRARTFPPFVS